MKPAKKVAIVLRMSGAAGRDILSGIFHFTRMNPHWHTRLFQMPSEFTPEQFKVLEAEGFDGIIASEPGPDATARLLSASKLPIAFIGDAGPILSRRKTKISYIRNDDVYIGRLAARYLAALGSRRSFGYLPTYSSQYWSKGREYGFCDELKIRGHATAIFKPLWPAGSKEDFSDLREWLKGLPKPAALLAAWDTRATQVIQLCTEAKLKIPEQISIIGVDNDELLDESTTPPLTSILPDHEKLGYVSARELERLMKGKVPSSSPAFLARPVKIVERESAIATAPAAHIITRATDYIRKNAIKGIDVADVAEFLGISRRLAELRFQQFSGESINEMIIRVRLDAIKKLLATTRRTIKSITLSCGYSDVSYVKTLFKRRFGMTMRDWRNSQTQ